jgi:major vault protein
MAYDERYENGNSMRQKDLVLAVNEFCFLQNKTNGQIKTYTGPIMLTISQQESLVVFDSKSKQFKEVSNFDQAKQTFTSAPENWYVILKNPAPGNMYPEKGKAVLSPDLEIGRKINLRGPISFSLFPGQMCKVIRGHALRSNQYLLARVYEAEAASKSTGEMRDAEGNVIEKNNATYVNGQILVIKGTEVSFYIPPTGIEVIPKDNDDRKGYVREAVTLERLEYCILKDEDGNKRYVHGPEVVFPKPTETFVTAPKGGFIFRAIELSKISGIYVKVIAEYKDTDKEGNEVVHPVGEELFITGNDQMIYYPRPEHAIISYDNKLMHHAIAIPEGEGRYIMDRMSGEIKTVKGPAMYLPDPRTEVVVKRKLTENQCKLWYPGNQAVLQYNVGLNEKFVEKSLATADLDTLTAYSCVTSASASLANLEAKANISRGTSYTKPRTITLDNRLDGVVSIDVWTGYAINVISKSGERKVVCGPQTVLLDYDQDLERLELSTGRPKTTDSLIKTVYLRHENNKVSDLINVETKDFVRATVKVSYCVDFDKEHMDKWFAVDNYVKYLCDRVRSLLKRAAKEYTIYDFYQNYSDIVRNVTLGINPDAEEGDCERGKHHNHRFFAENGMFIHDVEVLSIDVQRDVEELILDKQTDMIRQVLELADAQREAEIAEALSVAEKKKQELRTQELLNKMELQKKEAETKLAIQAQINRKQEAEDAAKKKAEVDMQPMIDAIAAAGIKRRDAEHAAEMKRATAEHEATQAHTKAMSEIEIAKQIAYAETVKSIMESISPDLIAALEVGGQCDMMTALAKYMSPYAIANGESVAETTQKLVNGLPFDLKEIMSKFNTEN